MDLWYIKQVRELAKDGTLRDGGVRDKWFLVTDRNRKPLFVANVWGDWLEIFDKSAGHREETTVSAPEAIRGRALYDLILEEASFSFDLDRAEIQLTTLNGKVLYR